MRSIKTSLIAGIAATVAMAAPAAAADMPMVYKAAPVVVEQFGGWYLRGDIGMTNQKVNSIDNLLFTPAVQVLHKDFETGMLFGVGVGYQFNNWFRADVTGEYRGKTAFRGLDIYPGGTNDYYGTKSEWLFLANAYIDLGTWWCVTPFVGAGIGYSRNTMDNFRDVNAPNLALAYGNSHSQWEFAWALHAGLAYKVTKNFTAELAYRYVNLGDFQSGDLIGYNGINNYIAVQWRLIARRQARAALVAECGRQLQLSAHGGAGLCAAPGLCAAGAGLFSAPAADAQRLRRPYRKEKGGVLPRLFSFGLLFGGLKIERPLLDQPEAIGPLEQEVQRRSAHQPIQDQRHGHRDQRDNGCDRAGIGNQAEFYKRCPCRCHRQEEGEIDDDRIASAITDRVEQTILREQYGENHDCRSAGEAQCQRDEGSGCEVDLDEPKIGDRPDRQGCDR